MQRFLLQQNISHFRRLLGHEPDEKVRHTIVSMLAAAERELALLEAALGGAAQSLPPAGVGLLGAGRAAILNGFTREFEASEKPMLLLHPGPGLHIIDLNDAYAEATMINRLRVTGDRLFDVFPDNPDDPLADGVNSLFRSLTIATETGQRHAMAIQRYDVRGPDGRFVERYWQPENTPLFDADGRVVALLHHVEDVTERVRASLKGKPAKDKAG